MLTQVYSKKKPSKEGWYWIRSEDGDETLWHYKKGNSMPPSNWIYFSGPIEKPIFCNVDELIQQMRTNCNLANIRHKLEKHPEWVLILKEIFK